MLDFPSEFFRAQEIEGFLVDATMKNVWAAELEVLREIAEICERHEITWYTAYGRCLGRSGMKALFHGMTIWIYG